MANRLTYDGDAKMSPASLLFRPQLRTLLIMALFVGLSPAARACVDFAGDWSLLTLNGVPASDTSVLHIVQSACSFSGSFTSADGSYRHSFSGVAGAAGANVGIIRVDPSGCVTTLYTTLSITNNSLLLYQITGTAGACGLPASYTETRTWQNASALSITTSSLPDAVEGQQYSARLTASGGTAPYAWGLSVGNLPIGLSYSSSGPTGGSISGTPTEVGAINFTMIVTDSAHRSAAKALTIRSSCAAPYPGDDRTTTIPEYKYYDNATFALGVKPFATEPSCSDFNTTYPLLNVGNGRTWALTRTPMLIGFEAFVANYSGLNGARTVNSAYRTPSHNAAVGGAKGSRHVFGDAVDINNNSRTPTEWNQMHKTALWIGADWIEPTSGPCSLDCLHADWRNTPWGYAQ